LSQRTRPRPFLFIPSRRILLGDVVGFSFPLAFPLCALCVVSVSLSSASPPPPPPTNRLASPSVCRTRGLPAVRERVCVWGCAHVFLPAFGSAFFLVRLPARIPFFRAFPSLPGVVSLGWFPGGVLPRKLPLWEPLPHPPPRAAPWPTPFLCQGSNTSFPPPPPPIRLACDARLTHHVRASFPLTSRHRSGGGPRPFLPENLGSAGASHSQAKPFFSVLR
jgi:hypothetical protein